MDPLLDDDENDIDDEPEQVVVVTVPVKKINYLNNKDMLKEIHRSKNSFCEYVDQKYSDYDVIVEDLQEIFAHEVQEKAKATRAARIAATAYEAALLANPTATKADKPRLAEFKVKPETISVDDLVFRVLGFSHIPLGKFSLERGSITNKLAKMFILMVNKYAQRGNWRGYTYLDEMKGQSLLQLAQMGLQFDEYKSDNPFSYYTASVSNSFTRVLNLEKKNQDLRDDLLIDSGASPSFSRQLAVEDEIRRLREDAQDAAKDVNH